MIHKVSRVARDIISERIVCIGSSELLVEFNAGVWCLEMAEIDDSTANGYAGLAIHDMVNGCDIPRDRSRRSWLAECKKMTPGYQLGSGLPHWMAASFGVVCDDEIVSNYQISAENLSFWGIDLFNGLAGTLLTTSLLSSRSPSPHIDSFKTAVFNELLARLDTPSGKVPGFAHGSLGVSYALIASKEKNGLARDYIEASIIEAEAELEMTSTCNLAICSGAISVLVIGTLAEQTIGIRPQAVSLYKDFARSIADRLRKHGDECPAHLCCGSAGVVETLNCYAHVRGDKQILEVARNLATVCITPDAIARTNETGLLFGVSGIDYVMRRLMNNQPQNLSILYPFI